MSTTTITTKRPPMFAIALTVFVLLEIIGMARAHCGPNHHAPHGQVTPT